MLISTQSEKESKQVAERGCVSPEQRARPQIKPLRSQLKQLAKLNVNKEN